MPRSRFRLRAWRFISSTTRLLRNTYRELIRGMVQSFACSDTRALFEEGRGHRQWRAFQSVAERKLDMVDVALRLDDLRSPPGHRLERLEHDRSGQWAIRIDGRWRVCFRLGSNGPRTSRSRTMVSFEAFRYRPEASETAMPRIRTHPGEVLNEEFIVPLGLSARRVARAIDVPADRIADIIRGRRGVTADTAHRLGACFGTSPQFWINLQVAHDLSEAEATHDYSSVRPLEPA